MSKQFFLFFGGKGAEKKNNFIAEYNTGKNNATGNT